MDPSWVMLNWKRFRLNGWINLELKMNLQQTPGDADPANRGAGSPTATMEVQKWGMRWALILPFNNGGK